MQSIRQVYQIFLFVLLINFPMKHIFELNARVSLSGSAQEKHFQLVTSLNALKGPWGISTKDIPFPGFGKESVAYVSLKKYFGQGIDCGIFYRYRNLLDDNSLSDDRMYIEFNSSKIDYIDFCKNVFPAYVIMFNAYRGIVCPKEISFLDFEKSRNVNLRDTIFRFYPLCFYDEELCRRALNLSAVDVVDRLTGQVETAQLFNDGALIIESSYPRSIEQANLFDLKIKSLLYEDAHGSGV
jgi:hypothetical protein